MTKAREAAPVALPGEERSLEASLRPQRLSDDEYINQEKVKSNLRILVDAAKRRGDPLEHVALYGPPGVGKTSLAYVIARELGVSIRVTSGPAIGVDPAAAHEIARRARGTPRIANRWLKRVRDFAQVRHDGRVTLAVAKEALAALEVDDQGLDAVDRMLLRAIAEKFSGGPVGVETLAAAVSEDTETIE